MKTFVALFAVLAVAAAAPTLPLVQIIVNVDAPASGAIVADKPVDPVHVVDNSPELPESIILPQPVFPEVIIPDPVVLPEPVFPEVIIPGPVVVPEIVIPMPVVVPEGVAPIMPLPEVFPMEDLDSNH